MAGSTGWKVLDIHLEDAPDLLVQSNFNNSGYEIKLTDLSRIWAETLSKDDIIEGALDVGSSIDPSEDNEQFKIFLGKIQGALYGEDGTSRGIQNEEAQDGRNLSLALSAPLPHPLPPFQWTCKLTRLEEDHVESDLVTPLIQQAANMKGQIESLIHELQEKDRVISKICDRLETSGNDLTTVFPGVSNIKTSRKKGQREQLARHVKGLGDFDEDGWRERVSKQRGTQGWKANDVLINLPQPDRSRGQSNSNWWELLGSDSDAELGKLNSGKKAGKANASQQDKMNGSLLRKEESVAEDEFQRQGTPPHLKRDASTDHNEVAKSLPADDMDVETGQANVIEDESTTDEDDDLDAAPRKMHSSQPQISASASPRKIGTLGGRSSKPSASPARQPTPPRKSPQAKPRSTLGMIGGKAKKSAAEASGGEEERQSSSRPPSQSSKTGRIGGNKESDASPPNPAAKSMQSPNAHKEPSPRQSRQPTRESTPQPRETSDERADKRRDRLKRELEEKAKVPVKKKRKF